MSQHKAIPTRRYAIARVIEYTSRAANGYSVCQVVRYAPLDEQDCPADPVVYIRTRVGEKPFTVRESQLRALRYTARFTPEAWVNDQAVEVDPKGPQEWDCTAYARLNRDYLARLEARGEPLDQPEGAVDNDDVFKGDPAAPQWVRNWQGPFVIRITRQLAEEAAVSGIFEAILAAGAAAVEAQDAAEEAAARHADARCRVAALIAASLLPAASAVVFDRGEDTVTGETEITVVNVRDSDGRLLWYSPGTGYADHPDAVTLGEPPALYPGDLADMEHQLQAAYDAHPGHFETAGEDTMPSANLLALPVPYPG